MWGAGRRQGEREWVATEASRLPLEAGVGAGHLTAEEEADFQLVQAHSQGAMLSSFHLLLQISLQLLEVQI